jgi:hypothetical protein
MNFLIEAFFIGVYASCIFWFLEKIVFDKYILLFITGFFKHFIGWALGLHTYYCQYGDACKKYISGPDTIRYFSIKYIPNHLQIWIESIFEGILFILFGIFFSKLIKINKYNSIFMIGFTLHILFEFLGFHDYFCRESCKRTF